MKDTVQRLTGQQAAYWAYEVSRKRSSDDRDRLDRPIHDACIDLNPHQVDAALFALESPFASGVLLADEVGLGKTVEAGLLLAQNWSERKRRLLVVCPASLTRQWEAELQDKFHLPVSVVTSATYATGSSTPWARDAVAICSYHFAAAKAHTLEGEWWDLVVFDEAHRLRNAYKTGNKIARSLQRVFASKRKVLLTATPLQNSLMELYGLMSILDTHLFGDAESFKSQFASRRSAKALAPLAERIAPYCRRTLRRDVSDYIKWTQRKSFLVRFQQSDLERTLYDGLNRYLQKEHLYAVPRSARRLMGLMLRKFQASSPAALKGTLEKLRNSLIAKYNQGSDDEQSVAALGSDWDASPAVSDEWQGDGAVVAGGDPTPLSSEEEAALVLKERQELDALVEQAGEVGLSAKAEALLKALAHAFELSAESQSEARVQKIQKKAVIFTESRRTQEYLRDLLASILPEEHIVLFDGTNQSEQAKSIVNGWRQARAGTAQASGNYSVDTRAALVNYFKNVATVMVATEAAAEGLNLQFCNLVINFDLPWNPQRIEQRIGRCHRYGQKCDVVVMNFLDEGNAADLRVYELLEQKLLLFDGVFGASDEILGVIGDDFDFERRICDIYDACRTAGEIDEAFATLQSDLEERINAAKEAATDRLISKFNPDVSSMVRQQSQSSRKRMSLALAQVVAWAVGHSGSYSAADGQLQVNECFRGCSQEWIGNYHLPIGSEPPQGRVLTTIHPLAEFAINKAKSERFEPVKLRVGLSESLLGSRQGWCYCCIFQGKGGDDAERLVGVVGDEYQFCPQGFEALMKCSADIVGPVEIPDAVRLRFKRHLEQQLRREQAIRSDRMMRWVNLENQKMSIWARDKEVTVRRDLDKVEKNLAELPAAVFSVDEGKWVERDSEQRSKLEKKRLLLGEKLLQIQKEAMEERDLFMQRVLADARVSVVSQPLFWFEWSCK